MPYHKQRLAACHCTHAQSFGFSVLLFLSMRFSFSSFFQRSLGVYPLLAIVTALFFFSLTTWASTMNETAQQRVTFVTSMGSFTLKLHGDKAPISVKNFIDYVESGFYDGLIFHRVIPDFMIQGGGFDEKMNPKPTNAPIKNEADNGLSNKRGSIAMARTRDVDSATAQFFINVSDNIFLNHGTRDFGYAVFGEVETGMDVIDAIAGLPTERNGPHADVPVEPIVIRSARVIQ